MKNLLLNAFAGACCVLSPYLISESEVQASDWGCQVVLCLSNPGSPTQFAQCRPPIQKLWRALAKGHSFPACSGVGFRSTRPGYEPYYCNTGYRLLSDYGSHDRQVTCVSASPQHVNHAFCSSGRDSYDSGTNSVHSPHWQWRGGHVRCMAYSTALPNVRSQPHYVDVTIDGSATQRVWY
ncbi:MULTISPECIES: hypothetical protein [unclassified Rhizobium]|uniref:hypothetical protein n=1 Tax=unclassified Rhizobium TaxID=2613769 RepID=UPI0009EC6C4D|nr:MULTISPECIES: hypothetical protein [unclassified Rhizobium]